MNGLREKENPQSIIGTGIFQQNWATCRASMILGWISFSICEKGSE